jgi:plasmid stabilization system protein ParE
MIISRNEIQRLQKKFFDESTKNSISSDLPFIGRERSSIALGVRSVVVGTHLIFYTVGSDSITIVRVIDGRMDIDEEFRR